MLVTYSVFYLCGCHSVVHNLSLRSPDMFRVASDEETDDVQDANAGDFLMA